MRLLCLIQDVSLPSSRVRVLNLVPSLRQSGVQCDVVPYPRSLRRKLSLFRSIPSYDAVLLQRKLITLPDLLVLRRLSRKLFFDFDDAIYQADDNSSRGKSWTRPRRFRSIVRRVDHVIAGNEILREEAARHNPSVSLLPSAVPVRDVPQNWHEERSGPVCIGWVGTKGNLRYLELLRPILRQLAQEFSIVVHVISDGSFSCEAVAVSNVPWSLERQEAAIAQFDIGVMPLPDTSWARGKCGYKALQYMAAGVPPICSAVGANAEAIESGRNGFAADKLDDYLLHLRRLIASRSLRRQMGEAARQTVAAEYAVEVVGQRLLDTIAKKVRA